MATAIDIYNIRPVFSDPEELMKALEPFIKGSPDSNTDRAPATTAAHGCFFNPEPKSKTMAATATANPKLPQPQSNPNEACDHIGGEFGDFKPLHSSVDAKLQVICQSLANSQKQGNLVKPVFVSEAKKTIEFRSQQDLEVPIQLQQMMGLENLAKGELGFLGTEDCKVESSSSPSLSDSDDSAGSSLESDIKSLDFTEPQPWDELENFVLQKFPSLEIDWEAILS
ncbi:hypothetical protein HHK36_030668 [Tetracentron sinense]|uniref:Uncharacterized protein n=1 Tax=Tetracentron sinense TaxID=13715 RepID=A0A835D1S1_TETSI|nr:hypothetical protein HHK36_030668 [Tetracentron sinense]